MGLSQIVDYSLCEWSSPSKDRDLESCLTGGITVFREGVRRMCLERTASKGWFPPSLKSGRLYFGYKMDKMTQVLQSIGDLDTVRKGVS